MIKLMFFISCFVLLLGGIHWPINETVAIPLMTQSSDDSIINIEHKDSLVQANLLDSIQGNNETAIVYSADITTGLIGTTRKHPVDNPWDNIFHINVPNHLAEDDVVYLEYQLFGVTNHTGIARSINDAQAVGGQFVKLSKQWSEQREAIALSVLRKGDNVIRFGLPLNATHHYTVKDVKLVVKKQTGFTEAIQINQPDNSYYGNEAYLKGILRVPVRPSKSESTAVQLYCDEQPVPVHNNEFEIILSKPPNAPLVFFTRLKAVFPSGKIVTKTVTFTNRQVADKEYRLQTKGITTEGRLEKSKELTLSLANSRVSTSIRIPAFATQNKVISITALRDVDLSALNADMVNVTKGSQGFRFLPHGSQFSPKAQVNIPFDSTLIPEGYSAADIRTYYFEESSRRWIALPTDTVMAGAGLVVSSTAHFTDMINAIIKVPESPVTDGYTPTTFKDFKAVDPSAGINQINLPAANSMGSAALGYNFSLPSGRQGMQPGLGLQYNNEAGNGWIGLGWNLSLPSIGIETRWGVPRYNAAFETETYIVNGEQLAPIAYRDSLIRRTTNKSFHPRVEGIFNRIIRHGSNPKEYWWEVTNKNGTTSSYGGTQANGGIINNAVLKDDAGNIAYWALVETRDINSNFVHYFYDIVNDPGVPSSPTMGRQIYIDKILYSGNGTTEGLYKVEFVRDKTLGEAKRKDVEVSARLGFKMVTTDLLRKVIVSFQNQLIRSYDLTYREGAFYKSLLQSISEQDDTGAIFYSHQFDYYDDVKSRAGYEPLKAPENWSHPDDNIKGDLSNLLQGYSSDASLLGSSKSKSSNHSLSIAIGLCDYNWNKTNTVGGNFGSGSGFSEGLVSLVDVNGDGLADKVFKKNGAIFYRPNLGDASKQFGAIHPINGRTSFSTGKSSTSSRGLEANLFMFSWGRQTSNTTNTTSEYFSDFNGDGLIDLASDGQVYFNRIDANGNPLFLPTSAQTPSPILARGTVNPQFLAPDLAKQAQQEHDYPLQDVYRFWQAPFDGNISINAPVQLVDLQIPGLPNRKLDGVRASIQLNHNLLWSDIIAARDYSLHVPSSLNNIQILKDQRIYFRVQSVYNGEEDVVKWDPVIRYNNAITPPMDADRRVTDSYKASKDFVLHEQSSIPINKAGKIKIDGNFSKNAATSDTVILLITKKTGGNLSIIKKLVFPKDTIVSQPVRIDSLDIAVGDSLRFILRSDSHIDRAVLQWDPHYEYIGFTDGSPVTNLDGQPTLQGYVVPDNANYNDWIIKTPLLINRQQDTISITPVIQGSASASGVITLTIKGVNRMYAKRNIVLLGGNIVGVPDSIPIIRFPNDTLFCEYSVSDRTLATALHTVKIIRKKDSAYVDQNHNIVSVTIRETLQAGLFTDPAEGFLGSLFRGWGQFSFKGGPTNAPLDPIKVTLNGFNHYSNNPNLYADTARLNQIVDASLTEFVPMYAVNQRHAWVGFDSSVYVASGEMGSSRLWMHDVSVDSVMAGASLSAVNKVSETRSTSYNMGVALGFASFTGTYSTATTVNVLDMMDMNHDRYPDILHLNDIQYTSANGALDSTSKNHNVGPATFEGESKGVSLGGSASTALAKNTPSENAANAIDVASSSIGLSANVNVSNNTDDIATNWIDINGDGLPDKIYKSGKVALNLGYSFTPPEDWGLPVIDKNTTSQSGGGVGFSLFSGSFQGGFSLVNSNGNNATSYHDVNGDGLPDKLEFISAGTIYVRFNTGTGFGSPILWNGLTSIRTNSSTGESVNAAFTITIPIIPPPFCFLKLCINPSVSAGKGVSRENTQIEDIDGDGFADFLQSSSDGNLIANRSTIERTNMLSMVKRPMGSSFTIDYKRVGNTYSLPQSKWVLSSVALYDGLQGDGVDTMRSSFSYEGGFYNRNAREFFGFSTVSSHQLNTAAGNVVYRTHVQRFLNNTYYTKGLLQSEWLQDAAGNKYTQTNNLYDLRTVLDSVQFPALVQTETIFYEGQPSVGTRTSVKLDYDALGNVTKINDAGDGSLQDILSAVVTYHNNNALYIKSTPASIVVTTSEGEKRKRTTAIDNRGNITQIRQFLADGTSAVYDLTYDSYGNPARLTRPANYKGERMWYDYAYDPAVHTYTTKVTDAFGYSSNSTYDYRFGAITGTVSMNNEPMAYKLDNRGRIATVTGPYELAAGKPYTIAFDYHPEAAVPYAVTRHYDPEYNADINIIHFMDGLGRSVQVKKQAALFRGKGVADALQMVVGGRTLYDAFGRSVNTYYPTTEPIGLANNSLSTSVGNLASTASYDVQDRPLKSTLADGATTSMTYTVANNLLSSVVTDALNNKKESLTDVKGRTRASKLYGGPNGTITTSFFYNALSELLKVTDNNNNATVSTYDNLGRRLNVIHPDAGLTEFKYDLAGNLTDKITAQIRKEIPNGGAIKYQYEYERLTDIDYPCQYQNKVKYVYGKAGTGSKAGRLLLQEDASGGQEFFYGKLGEVIKTIRTVLVSPIFSTTYVSEQEYDTWNRIKKMTYPDGEVIKYHYNRGGGLYSFDGYKQGNAYKYIDQLGYDEYEQRTYLRYGNGTETNYSYDTQRRWLATLKATTGTGRPMMNNTYRFDAAGNILNIVNNVKAEAGKLGGYARQDYRYDNLYRVDFAIGHYEGYKDTTSYSLKMAYDNLYNIVNKKMTSTVQGRSYELLFKYGGTAPHQATQIGGINYKHDANGNRLGYSMIENHWDEENRLMAVFYNGTLSQYTYDAGGERVIKSSGGLQGIWVNGAPAGAKKHNDNYTAYVSPYLVCRRTGFTKHFYIESQRVVTKIGNGEFTNISFPLPVLTAGGVDYIKRAAEIEKARIAYYTSQGLPPGPPLDKNFWGRPENNGNAAPVFADNTYTNAPPGWPTGTAPLIGQPINMNGIPSRDSVKAGYGFKGNGNFYEKDQYFYHPDHLGSTSYVTDAAGEINQHTEYSAFGEPFFDEHATSFSTPYLFNAKERDIETGYYYYGARYYDPRTSQWLSVDPLAEKYQGLSPYNYCLQNPIRFVDPDGKIVNLATGAIGAGVGAVIGGGIEIASQLYSNNSVNNWTAVGGAALQGGITGGAAGFTGGASLLATTAVAGAANAVGGTANRAIQGQITTASDVVIDATIGAGLGAAGKVAGNVVEGYTNNLSPNAKGNLGEAITQIKYAVLGYESTGKAVVKTGLKTATGRIQVAKYDHAMKNVITGKQLTVESKFNKSPLTRNQTAAQSKITTPGGLIVDRTTSEQLGNAANAATTGAGAGAAAQRNINN